MYEPFKENGVWYFYLGLFREGPFKTKKEAQKKVDQLVQERSKS